MRVLLDIKRCKGPADTPYRQVIPFETEDPAATVATALLAINSDPDVKDIDGKIVEPIMFEPGCLQKKCGGCAMRINKIPRLACEAKLSEFKSGKILLEPLRKFPLVSDLCVDRSIMRENLSTVKSFLPENVSGKVDDTSGFAFDASLCLQCGLCLEVCPNFYAGSKFTGTASAVPLARLLEESRGDKSVRQEYREHVFEGCGKSLACHDVCPAGIDTLSVLVHSSGIANWGRTK